MSDKSSKADSESAEPSDSLTATVNETTSSRSLGLCQIYALLIKNFRYKLRTPLQTCVEVFSPVCLMLILVAAYSLSEVEDVEAQTYHTVELEIPGPWPSIFQQLQEVNNATSRRLVSRPTEFRELQLVSRGDDDEVTDDEEANEFDELNEALAEIRRLLKGPVTVPTMDQYVQLSNQLSALIPQDEIPAFVADSSTGRTWGNLLTLGTLHMTPVSEGLLFWEYLNQTLDNSTLESLRIRLHESSEECIQSIDDNLQERAWALLELSPQHALDDENTSPSYAIRMNYTVVPNTAEIIDYVSIGLNRRYQRYLLSGFSTLQQTLNAYYMSDIRGDGNSTDCSDIESVWSMPMPTAAYSQNSFFQAVGFLLGLTIAMAHLYPVSRLIKLMVEEKETKMRETLFILGTRPWAHWFSWVISSLFLFGLIAAMVTFVLTTYILKFSNPAYLYTWIFLFATSCTSFCFVVSALFSRAKLASIVGPMALFATLLPRYIFFGSNRNEAVVAKRWASILPATAFAFGADIIADYEYAEQGIQSWNANEGGYSFNTCLGFLFFDTLFLALLGWYLDQIMPRQYGRPRSVWFPFSPKYWFSCLAEHTTASTSELTESDRGVSSTPENTGDSSDSTPSVRICNLTKHYYPRKKTELPPALDSLNLSLYDSQITCYLGHNGAGKSTTVALLTGLLPPTDGDCYIYGKSIVQDRDDARRSIGICFQENILFDRLTVMEHIIFFQRIKGAPAGVAEAKSFAAEAGLGDFFHSVAGSLSGGNKRKLCVAIALCGNPQFLILDEPTSGMDPGARRKTWDLLRKRRLGRTTLLMTHFMDEAELLSDRVAILYSGKLKCAGPLLSLKLQYGLGYVLKIVLERSRALSMIDSSAANLEIGSGPSTGTSTGCVHTVESFCHKILEVLNHHVPSASLKRIAGEELTFNLPKGSESLFPAMFHDLESKERSLNIRAVGMQSSSLEDLFLLLTPNENGEHRSSISNVSGDESLEQREVSAVSRGPSARGVSSPVVSITTQIRVLFQKRLLFQGRDRKGLCISIGAPVLVIALVLLILTINPSVAGPRIEISPNLFEYSSSGSRTRTEMVVGTPPNGSSGYTSEEPLGTLIESTYEHVDANLVGLSNSSSISTFLLDSINQHDHYQRYGAFSIDDSIEVNANIDLNELQLNLNASGFGSTFPMEQIFTLLSSINETTTTSFPADLSILFNSSSPHSVAAFQQSYAEHMYQLCTGKLNARLLCYNHPLPLTTTQELEIKTVLSILASLFILIPYCYIPGAFVVFLVKEKASKSKHLQLVSGTNLLAYWLAEYLFDLLLFTILTLLTMTVFLIYGRDSAEIFVGDTESFFCTFCLTLGYGSSILPFSYLVARRYDNHSSAQLSVIAFVFVTGFVAVNAYFIMDSIETTKGIARSLRPLFRMWPAFNVGDGFLQMASAFWERRVLGELSQTPFKLDVAGNSVVLLFGLSPVYFLLLIILEYFDEGAPGGWLGIVIRKAEKFREKWFLRFCGVKIEDGKYVLDDGLSETSKDMDVVEEEKFVSENIAELVKSSPIFCENIWKVYPPSIGLTGVTMGRMFGFLKRFLCRTFSCVSGDSEMHRDHEKKTRLLPKRAIRGLSLALQEGEIFALLGVNGAGKSTFFSILTGDTSCSRGCAFVAGHRISGDSYGVAEARKLIGYCPQVDPLLDLLTPRETLTMYGRLRGITKGNITDCVDRLLERVLLVSHADKPSGTLSGGNKRKLSLGIALIGDPEVILVDESSSGLDPIAKRKLWSLISDISQDKSVILSTHSMEEAEALCTRAGILREGEMLCIGTVQQLKTSYLAGYTIDCVGKVSANTDQMNQLVQKLLDDLPGSSVVEHHDRFVRLSVPSFSIGGLGGAFSRLESLLSCSSLENYTINQCALEEVFLRLNQETVHDISTEAVP